MEMLCSEELTDWKMRTAIIYRSERKKILHSQLHMVDWISNVLSNCEEQKEPGQFRDLTFKKNAFE